MKVKVSDTIALAHIPLIPKNLPKINKHIGKYTMDLNIQLKLEYLGISNCLVIN